MNYCMKFLPLFFIPAFALAMLSGCEVQDVDGTTQVVNANVTGVYRNTDTNENNGASFVSQQTGNTVTYMDLRQTGKELQGVDNNRRVFTGEIGSVSDSAVNFTLEGATTAGNAVTISGNIEVGDGNGTMRATWIESSLYGIVYAVANGPTINTNFLPSTNALTLKASDTEIAVGESTILTASGGNPPYDWDRSPSGAGDFENETATTIKFTRGNSGDVTITVTDDDNASASVVITD